MQRGSPISFAALELAGNKIGDRNPLSFQQRRYFEEMVEERSGLQQLKKYFSTSSATASHVRACAVQAIKPRSHWRPKARFRPAEISCTFESTKIPKSPETNTSGTPPTRVATTGVPHASDSITTLGMPSRRLHKQLTSAPLNQSLRSSFF